MSRKNLTSNACRFFTMSHALPKEYLLMDCFLKIYVDPK